MNDKRTYLAQLDIDAQVTEAEHLEQIETELRDELYLTIKAHIENGDIDMLDWYLDEKGIDYREFLKLILDNECEDSFSHTAITVLIYRKTHNDQAVNDVVSYFVGKMDFESLLNTEIERRKINDSYDIGGEL